MPSARVCKVDLRAKNAPPAAAAVVAVTVARVRSIWNVIAGACESIVFPRTDLTRFENIIVQKCIIAMRD